MIFSTEKTPSSSSSATARQCPTAAMERENRRDTTARIRLSIKEYLFLAAIETPEREYKREILILYRDFVINEKRRGDKKKTHDECSQPHKASFFYTEGESYASRS